MYKLYIVDDESHVIEGLRTCIPWENHGLTITGTSDNGAKAYDDILELMPDIVITDIKMPQMDGIELVNKVHEQFPQIGFIIFSGYNDFYYARKALLSNVVDFLVKPSSTEEILQAVNAAVMKIAQHSVIGQVNHDSSDYRKLLESVFLNPVSEIYTKNYYYVVLISTHETANITVQEKEADIVYAGSVIHSSYLDILECHLAVLESENMLEIQEWEYISQSIRSNLKVYFSTPNDFVVLGISDGKKLHKLKEGYQEALEAVEYCKWFSCKFGLFEEIEYTDINASSRQMWGELKEACKNNDMERVTDILRQEFEYFSKIHISRNSLKEFCINAYFKIGEVHTDGRYSVNPILEIGNLLSVQDAFNYLLNVYRLYFAASAEQQNFYKNRIVQKVMKFVHENYQNPISLNDAADYVNKSPGYLSNKFKKEAGVSFTQYVTDYRILKAKELLISTNMKVKEIAVYVGFQDEQYFSLVFKKECGLTAGGYRKIYYDNQG